MYRRWLLLLSVVWSLFPTSMLAESQNKPKVIGVLMSGTAAATMPYIEAFIHGMSELGWVDGKTVQYIMRFDEDDKRKLADLCKPCVTECTPRNVTNQHHTKVRKCTVIVMLYV